MDKPTHILSVDPGVNGALALYKISTKVIHISDMPLRNGQVSPEGVAVIVDIFKSIAGPNQIHAAVENVSSMPRQAGSFNFGRSAGVVHGVLGALAVSMELVSPNAWKGAMGLRKLPGETQEQNKTRARALAIELWPEQAGQFKRVKDDGRAEAALLARYFANKKGWM